MAVMDSCGAELRSVLQGVEQLPTLQSHRPVHICGLVYDRAAILHSLSKYHVRMFQAATGNTKGGGRFFIFLN